MEGENILAAISQQTEFVLQVCWTAHWAGLPGEKPESRPAILDVSVYSKEPVGG